VKRSILVASLPHGPWNPVTSTPARRPGSVRRTTAIDQRRNGPGQPMDLTATGRDLCTAVDGSTTVVDEITVRAQIDPLGILTAIDADPPVPALADLIGAKTSRGFRALADAAVPEHVEEATVLHQLLDDVPTASLISLYGTTRDLGDDWNMPAESVEGMRDLCAGWIDGGTMLGAFDRTAVYPIPLGPPAPELAAHDDPIGWHDLDPLAPRSIRRRRRLDLIDGDPLELDVYFRDSYRGPEGGEDVLHEYTVTAAVDPGPLEVRSCEATAHTLPWPECPGALASAGRIVGEPVGSLRRKVHAELTGTTTCTHLNDVLRSLAGVAALARSLGD